MVSSGKLSFIKEACFRRKINRRIFIAWLILIFTFFIYTHNMYDILTIGTATRDVFLRSSVFKPIKDQHFTSELGFTGNMAECLAFGGKIDIECPVMTTGGGSTNAAVTFARYGLKSAAIISLGKDEHGKAILSELKREEVRPIASYSKDLQTSYSTILLSPDGERTILVYRGASDYMGRVGGAHLKSKWAYIVPGAIPLPRMKALIGRLKSEGARIAMNPSGHYIKLGITALADIFKDLQVVIMNKEEASSLTGLPYEDGSAVFKKMDELVDGIVVMTDGPNGVSVSDGRMIYKAGIFKEKVLVDRTGAGDAFGSAFVAGLIDKEFSDVNIKYAIRFGSANATSVVEYIGAKAGILTKSKFDNDNRWGALDITTSPIDG